MTSDNWRPPIGTRPPLTEESFSGRRGHLAAPGRIWQHCGGTSASNGDCDCDCDCDWKTDSGSPVTCCIVFSIHGWIISWVSKRTLSRFFFLISMLNLQVARPYN